MENSEIIWTGGPDDQTARTCSILFDGHGFEDKSGCLKPEAHNDAHICIDQYGEFVQWEDDMTCECGCWDEWEEGDGEVCMIYRNITELEAKTACEKAYYEHLKTR